MFKYIFSYLFILLSCGFIQAQEMTIVDAIDKASHQRMLTQKMLNCYLRLGSGVETAIAKDEMDSSVAQFEEYMIELLDFTPNEEVEAAIEKAQASWRVYSLKLLSQPNKIMGTVLFRMSGKVVKEYNGLLDLLVEQAQTEKARLVNLSGKQAMLSQRMEMLYLSLYWGLPSKAINDEFENVNEELADGLSTLLATEINTPQIKKELGETAENWEFVQKKFSDTNKPSLITDATKAMLIQLNNITKQYAKLAVDDDLGSADNVGN
ncbi:MAG: hypothetical protein AB8G22_21315 [Saprospiraceae bacterium]